MSSNCFIMGFITGLVETVQPEEESSELSELTGTNRSAIVDDVIQLNMLGML